ncbi:MAG: S8 family peptidase [Photobacterium frigidiphilum]|uniref:S8 family peptidase n=1 Tax=Photobacterium frigidiphilum TaxID=264736 RepID=UPI00300326A8
MKQKRPILSKAELYTNDIVRKNPPPGDKKIPYSYGRAKRRIFNQLASTIAKSNELPNNAFPNGNIVTKMTLHPSFLAKSYFPDVILKKYKLQSVGSKEVFIKPDVRVGRDQDGDETLSSSLYFVSGQKDNFELLLDAISSDTLDEACREDLIKFEDISFFDGGEKINPSALRDDNQATDLCYEIVLHASNSDKFIVESFYAYISTLDGSVFESKTRTIKGLTFCFIKLSSLKIKSLANFSFIRVVRPIPELNLSDKVELALPDTYMDGCQPNFSVRDNVSNIAIFDAGLGADDCDNANIRYFDLTHQNTDLEENYVHGALVTSAVAFGEADSSNQYAGVVLPVDHFKVYSNQDSFDIGLVDVLDRIVGVLTSKQYKFVNISLGPKVPCPDDEPSLWTSTLDDIASKGDTLIVVAVGNEGIYLNTDMKDLARIQPPSDMLNGLSIGAANSKAKDWSRASYSCIGPGRRPGFVKPDALYFGGESNEKLKILGLSDFQIHEIIGTSFAAPLVTRLAALIDRSTNGELNVATIRALLIHSTGKNSVDRIQCGWGRISHDIEDILYCSKNTVTVIYQGILDSASGVRASVPCPKALTHVGGMVNIDATVCFYTDVDQQHTVSYTRAGLEITFRPDFNNVKKDAAEAATRSLFTKKKIFGTEQSLRRDAHKWETCYKVDDRIRSSGLNEPMFDIKYLTRDEGHSRSASEMRNLQPLSYSLVVTISLEKDFDLYSTILNEYNLLTPIDISLDAIVNV